MTVALDARDHKFLEDLKATSVGRQIEQEAHKSAAQKREALAARIASIRAERAEERPKHATECQAAYEKAVAAEAVFREAERALAAACYRNDADERLWRHRIDMCEAELRATASNEIKKFTSSMLDMLGDKIPIQKKILPLRTPHAYGPPPIFTTNVASIAKRRFATLAAIKQAEELALLPDQSEVPARLEEIRSKIPEVQSL